MHNETLQFLACPRRAQPVRISNREAELGYLLLDFSCAVLLHSSAAKGWGDGGYGGRGYRVLSGTTDTERVFDRMIEQRDIKLAIRSLVGQGFTSGEIEEAVQNRLVRIPGWHFPGDFCSASGNLGEPGERTYVGPTYYLITARARIMRYMREIAN